MVSVLTSSFAFHLQRKEQEKDVLNNLLKDKDLDEIESIVYQVLRERHFQETVRLAAQHEREKAIAINEKKNEVTAARQSERDNLTGEQEKAMIELVSSAGSISSSDLAQRKLDLKKDHKKQLVDFDKHTQVILESVASKVSPGKDIQYSADVLALREQQIKELAEAMEEFSPELTLVKSYAVEAERAKKEAEQYRKEMLESRDSKIAKLKEERRRKEDARRKERENKVKELEAEVEKEREKDMKRQEQLKERYKIIQEKRLAEQEALHKKALDTAGGMSDQERQVSYPTCMA